MGDISPDAPAPASSDEQAPAARAGTRGAAGSREDLLGLAAQAAAAAGGPALANAVLRGLARAAGFGAPDPQGRHALDSARVARLLQDHLVAQGRPDGRGRVWDAAQRAALAQEVQGRLAAMEASPARLAACLMRVAQVQSQLTRSLLLGHFGGIGADPDSLLGDGGLALGALPAQLPLSLTMPLDLALQAALSQDIVAFTRALTETAAYIERQVQRIEQAIRQLQQVDDAPGAEPQTRTDAAALGSALAQLAAELQSPQGLAQRIAAFVSAAQADPPQAAAALRELSAP